ncbi:MAG: glycosyltransferase family 2 protein, partial [Planococcus sp. (in: firmicutes)]|nr:glycosyltransferase family 2 protein [Planococcus sp. (in: firmicutes)]
MKQFAVVIPAYKPEEPCKLIIEEAISAGFSRIIVVNDGSGADYEGFFDELEKLPQVTLLTHAVNQGKGRALKTVFHYILNEQLPIEAIITADADGQHLVSDMVRIADELEASPNHVVLGARDFSQPNIPFRSRFGNR